MKYFLLFLGLFPTLPLKAKLAPLAELKAGAKSGDLAARIALAHRRFDSIGDTRDPELIYQAFNDGAKAGLADAYAGLSLCLSSGFGCQQNSHQAYRLARLAADLGSARGYYALGSLAMNRQPVSAMGNRIQGTSGNGDFLG